MLCNIHMIDTFDGKKIKRKDKGVNNDKKGFYASEAKLFLE